MISNESYQLIHGLLGSRRDQEACNVKNALKSEGYKRGNATMIEYVEQRRKSVQLCQQAIDELKDARGEYESLQKRLCQQREEAEPRAWMKAQIANENISIDTNNPGMDELLEMWVAQMIFILSGEKKEVQRDLLALMHNALEHEEERFGGSDDEG